jgi:hypothetical protein
MGCDQGRLLQTDQETQGDLVGVPYASSEDTCGARLSRLARRVMHPDEESRAQLSPRHSLTDLLLKFTVSKHPPNMVIIHIRLTKIQS